VPRFPIDKLTRREKTTVNKTDIRIGDSVLLNFNNERLLYRENMKRKYKKYQKIFSKLANCKFIEPELINGIGSIKKENN
jgi:hypothetical protein